MSSTTYYEDGDYVIRTLGAGNVLYLFPAWCEFTSDNGVAFGNRGQTITRLRRIVEALEADASEDAGYATGGVISLADATWVGEGGCKG